MTDSLSSGRPHRPFFGVRFCVDDVFHRRRSVGWRSALEWSWPLANSLAVRPAWRAALARGGGNELSATIASQPKRKADRNPEWRSAFYLTGRGVAHR